MSRQNHAGGARVKIPRPNVKQYYTQNGSISAIQATINWDFNQYSTAGRKIIWRYNKRKIKKKKLAMDRKFKTETDP